ncbi:MAG: hypothetical protein ACREE4_14460 [Stellaceae bacterium]
MRLHLGLWSVGMACLIGAIPAFAQSVSSGSAQQTTLTVGAGGQYQTISAAVAAADADTDLNNYYVIDVMPGTYTNDFPLVTRPMTIEAGSEIRPDGGSTSGPVVLQATEPLPNEKGIILTTASLTVTGLTFTGAYVDDSLGGNGAGIRDQNTGPASLVIQNSTFIGNETGVLTGDDADETITVINSSFENNGNPNGDGYEHGLYVNYAGSLTVSNSLFCGQLFGHDIKSRAAVTTVTNSQIYVGAPDADVGCNAGQASYNIDVPNGGGATISGNQIIEGSGVQNHKMIAYGEEGLRYGNNSLLVIGNSFVSIDVSNAIAVYDPYCIIPQLSDNTFQGVSTILYPPTCGQMLHP